MKAKLFYLFIAVFAFTFSGNAQVEPECITDNGYPCITIIGNGVGGWTKEAEKTMLTEDGVTYNIVDLIVTKSASNNGELKFREGRCWTDKCPVSVGNVYGWGPPAGDPQSTGWPSGSNNDPKDNGPNIKGETGVWNVTFNRIDGSWAFTPGTPLPVINLVGSAVSSPVALTSEDGVIFTAKKVSLIPGTCQFDVNDPPKNTGLVGGLTFPGGVVTGSTEYIPVSTTGIDYDVTFNYETGGYDFKVATFPKIAIIGSATQQGWPNDPQVDENAMTTTDGETYKIAYVALNGLPDNGNPAYDPDNALKFRQDNSWANNWGGLSFPTGPTDNSKDIFVDESGNYSCVFTKSSGAYVFTINDIGLIGSAITGSDAGWGSDIDMATTDGINYTLTQQLYSVNTSNGGAAKVKFRLNNDWAKNWGGTSFPTGPVPGDNEDIVVTADGVYAIKFNIFTGVYDFGTPLGVKNFTIAGLKTYPNPSKNNWNITANEQITSVQLFDILGKSVYNKTTSSNEVSVNASKLTRGVYFAKISTEKGSTTVKLVKE